MQKKIAVIILLTQWLLFSSKSLCQTLDSTSFKINTRFSFYSFEKEGELLLHASEAISGNLSIAVKVSNQTIVSLTGKSCKKLIRLPFALNLQPGNYKVSALINLSGHPEKTYIASSLLTVLTYKSNEVKTDRLTGGLIVNKHQFFPFGFYCYSPVYPTLAEEEVVKGFNMMSPYQKIIPETLSDRKTYMDRCAALGMKVHFNLLSVSGGGGVGCKIDGLSDDDKRKRLISEILMFRDHPALLGWYISDEPTGNKVTPEELEEIYETVKKYDPWHPVSIVFMAPFLSSKKYSNATDIVMADPYPLPDRPVSVVGDIAGQLEKEFRGKRPVWIVPQAFGGGELWGREPTIQEIRSMTWQSIINGATGIQYFVRQGLNSFPKSVATWGECGRIAMEVAELTPWLLSEEDAIPVESGSGNVAVASKLHKGQLMVMAVNKVNEPSFLRIRIPGVSNKRARSVFENRSVTVKGGFLNDQIGAYGSEVYLIDLNKENPDPPDPNVNLVRDPGFEDISSPGVPSACYARPGGDRGATYFLDTREQYEGNHSLRLVTPSFGKSVSIRFFPFQVHAGSTYSISVWAKSDPEQNLIVLPDSLNDRQRDKKREPQYVEITLGDFGHARFVPDNEWRQYITFITVPSDTISSFKANLVLKMPGQGVAWFDNVKVTEDK